MGNEQPKAPQRKQLTQFQVDVACLKVKGYVELNRDRRTNQALMKEKNLNEMLRLPTRQKVDEYQKFQSLVQDVRFIETCNIVIRYADIIKDQSIRICKSNGDASQIADVMPYIESILFAADNLNLQQVMEFKDLMVFFFGPGLYDTNKLLNVDPEMKKLYKNPLPDAFEVNEFVIKFAQKYGFSEDQINAAGHQFSSKFLQPSVGGILIDPSLIGQQPQQGFGGGFPNQPNQQQFGGPGFGNPQQGGFGGNGFCNDFPPQNGGYGGGFGQNQGGQQQGFGGNQNDFGYQNGGYGGTSNNQSGYPQNGGFQNLPPPQQQGGFTNLPPPQGQGFGGNQQGGLGGTQQGGFGGPQQGGFGGPQQGGFGGTQQGGYGGAQTGGFGGAQQPGGFGGAQSGGFGGATSGGFGGATGGNSSSNPYGNIAPSNINNPYAAQTKGPSIMASQSMKAPQTQQQQQFVPIQPSIPQQPQQQTPQPPQNNDLDDLEQRLARLQKGL